MYRDSLGNTYDRLPARKPTKGAKAGRPGPKHGRKSKYNGPKKAHGIGTGMNGSPWYIRALCIKGVRHLGREPKPDGPAMRKKLEASAEHARAAYALDAAIAAAEAGGERG